MRALFDKLESPAVTNLSVSFSAAQRRHHAGGRARSLSRRAAGAGGEAVARSTATMEIKGRIGDRPWSVTLPLANAAEGKGLSKLWARRKIADAEVAKTLRKATPEETDKRILALGLDHQLVTRLTSLVAVDKTPSRPDGAKLVPRRPAAQSPGRLGLRQGVRRTPQARSRARTIAPQPNAPVADRSANGSATLRPQEVARIQDARGRAGRGGSRMVVASRRAGRPWRHAAEDRDRCGAADDRGLRPVLPDRLLVLCAGAPADVGADDQALTSRDWH